MGSRYDVPHARSRVFQPMFAAVGGWAGDGGWFCGVAGARALRSGFGNSGFAGAAAGLCRGDAGAGGVGVAGAGGFAGVASGGGCGLPGGDAAAQRPYGGDAARTAAAACAGCCGDGGGADRDTEGICRFAGAGESGGGTGGAAWEAGRFAGAAG